MKENSSKRSGKAGIIISIILCVIFLPIIILNLVIIIKTYTNPEHLPGIFGYKPAIVLSGSMSPLFEAESLIFLKSVDTAELKEGDVICYLSGGTAVTHRIEQIVTNEGQVSYITKGDANNTADRLPVLPSQVEGIYVGQISGIGGFAMFMQSTTGIIIFIALPILIYLVYDFISRRRDGKQTVNRTAELEAELLKLRNQQEEKTKAGI